VARLTEREALTNCRKHWQDICDGWANYTNCKDIDTLKTASLAAVFPEYLGITNSCFVCEYSAWKSGGYRVIDCKNCLIEWSIEPRHCNAPTSPYSALYHGDMDVNHVKAILKLIDQAIDKLPPLKRKAKKGATP
jgi:hypothetical protein